jgi:hypothetical protein
VPTPSPLAQVAVLQGRPSPPPDTLNDGFCRRAFPPGGLAPADLTAWNPGPDPATTEVDDAQARAEVTTIMRRRFRNDDPDHAVDDALSLYASVRLRVLTDDDPALRAALVELKGTIGEPALQFVLASPILVHLRFGAPPIPGFEAGSVSNGVSVDLVVDEKDRGEHPALLTPIIFHELLQQSGRALYYQVLVVDLLQDRVLLEQLRDDPEALVPTTDLSRDARWAALGQLDTRVGSDMTGFRSDIPIRQSAPRDDYHNAIDVVHVDPDPPDAAAPSSSSPLHSAGTTGSPAITAVLQSMAPDGSSPSPADIDADTAKFIDAHAGVSPCDQLLAAGALGVLPPGSVYDDVAEQYRRALPG